MGDTFALTHTGNLETTVSELGSTLRQIEPGSLIKHYELIRRIGEGGMGQVFYARDTKLGRLVAIKIVTAAKDGAQTDRWLAEARATARCNHENIVIIHEVDEFESLPYMVLEYVDGVTLRSWMQQRSMDGNPEAEGAERDRVSPTTCIELMLPVARALASAHELGIVHRDLKPENILLAKNGVIKVVDFGIAAWLDTDEERKEQTHHGRGFGGTPPYMSPEALENEGVDHRTDIWAMGIILYELVVGHHPLAPFSRSRMIEILDLNQPMPSARAFSPELGGLIDRCLEKRKELRLSSAHELVAELTLLRNSMNSSSLLDTETPFAGLLAFQEADQNKFFGRDRLIAGVLARLRFQPIVAIGGPSGAGKSSFVRAGLIPAYKRAGDRREALVVRPGPQPLLALGNVLSEIADKTREDLHTSAPDLNSGPEALANLLQERPGLLGTVLRAWSRARGPRAGTLLVVDQFEELQTLCSNPAEREAFLSCLEGAADDATSPLRVVVTVRSDFLDRLATDRKLFEDITTGLLFLPPLDKEGLREALTKPIEAFGYQYESQNLIDRMLVTMEKTAAPLPLLQFTAAKLWEARDVKRRLLTEASYDRLGGVEGTLASHADTVVASMAPRDKQLTRRFFERLVTPERTRAIASETDLQELATDPTEAERVLSRLVNARLLVTEKKESGVTVEIAHESLIARWPMLSRWLDENKEDAEFLNRLRVAAQQWRESGKPRGLLWRDEAFLEARRFRERRRIELPLTEQTFLDAVFQLGQTVARRRKLMILGVIAASLLVAVVTGTLAWKEHQARGEAQAQGVKTREFAEQARVEAAHSRDAARIASARNLEDDPTLALGLLREIERPEEMNVFPWMAGRAVRRTIAEAVLPGHGGQVWTAEISPDGQHALTAAGNFAYIWDTRGFGPPIVLRGHTEAVWRATYSPDGSRILTASWDKTARIWLATGGDPVILPHSARVSWAAWSPDGKRVVTAGWDPAAYVFAADGKSEPMVLRGHTERLRRASFSPDGARVVTASLDDTARVWHLDGTHESIVLRGHQNNIVDAVFSPDGKRVATISADQTARIFPADGSAEPKVLTGHTKALTSVSWSPDGKRLATASKDHSVRVWRLDTDDVPPIVLAHGREVQMVTFSPDGKHLLTGSADNYARLWTVGALPTMTELVGHELGIEFATFSRDGKHLITAGGDGAARIWSTEQKNAPVIFRGAEDNFPNFRLSPDGKLILMVWPGEPIAHVWSVDGISEPRVLRANGAGFQSIDWNGNWILTAHDDGSARIWNVNEKIAPIVLSVGVARPDFLTLSNDRSLVGVAYEDGSLRIFRVDGTGEPKLVVTGGSQFFDVTFLPGDRRIMTAAKSEQSLRLWNIDTGECKILEGHTNDIIGVSYTPDHHHAATFSADGTTRIWNTDNPSEVVILRGHSHKVVDGGFSPDGNKIVSVSADGTLRIWSVDGSGEPIILRQTHAPPRHAVWSHDGSRIATSSEHEIYVWNADGSGLPLVLEGHKNRIHRLLWSPDGTFVASSSNDGTVRLWHNVDKASSLAELLSDAWRLSSFCMSVSQRRDILGASEEAAQKDLERCRAKVSQ